MLSEDTRRQIDSLIQSNRIVLFMKGNRQQPQCGFSATVIQILEELGPEYETVDVLADPAIRDGIKTFSSWPTIPQLYVGGEFLGGCDIIRELYGNGELHAKFGLAAPERVVPTLHVSDRAAEFLKAAIAKAGETLHVRIDPSFQTRAYLGPQEPGEIASEANGVTFHFDLPSAKRGEGIKIDYVETATGHDLAIDNPNAPTPVQQMDVATLKQLIDSGQRFHFFDVRSPEERATASIPGTQLVDAAVAAEIEKLPKDAMLVFHCHHGGRSQQAAEHFRSLGYKNVHNVVGGIDAWSQQIDPSVPRY
jgi:monothiol glutaredoxin